MSEVTPETEDETKNSSFTQSSKLGPFLSKTEPSAEPFTEKLQKRNQEVELEKEVKTHTQFNKVFRRI